VGGALLVLLILGGVLLPLTWQRGTPAVATEPPTPQRLSVPEVITRPLPARMTPTAAPIVQDPVPIIQAQPDTTPDTGRVIRQQSFLETLNPFATQAVPVPKEPPAAQTSPSPTSKATPTAPKEPPPRKGWAVLATPKQREPQPGMTPVGLPGHEERPSEIPVATQGQHGTGAAQNLIQPARWAIPAQPLKTIYRSQTLTGRLLQAVNSDIPGGQVKMQLTTPVLDRFGYDTVILPKDTLIIASQDTAVRYGTTRLGLKIEQLELPSGEVIAVQAMVGDQSGANGVPGKVNNHLGKVILATGLSAILNIGVRTATGTPGAGQFFQNPIQQTGADIGQAVQRDTQSIIDRELRVPPTVTIPAGTFCTINLTENITFARPPVMAR